MTKLDAFGLRNGKGQEAIHREIAVPGATISEERIHWETQAALRKHPLTLLLPPSEDKPDGPQGCLD